MKKIFLLIIMIILTGSIFGIDVSGNQSGTWTLANSPYNVIDDVTVVSGTTLMIEPGVIVEFDLSKKITVYGDIQAIGTISDSIHFQSGYTWDGIKIVDTASCNLIYCVISGSDNSGLSIKNSTDILLQYCHLYNNSAIIGGGINIDEESNQITINCCEINNNLSTVAGFGGGGIATSGGHHYFIQACSIHDNEAISYGGGIFINESSYTTIGNTNNIQNNQAVTGGGICIFKGTHNNIMNNVITNNDAITTLASGGGVYLMTACNITGNYISENTSGWSGGGIYAALWSVEDKIIYGNSIFENTAAHSGGGIYITGYPRIEQCNIYDNNANIKGGGICVYGNDDGILEIIACDIDHNIASSNQGGGIYARASSPFITRSIISFNVANEGGGIYIVDTDNVNVTEPGISNIINCVIYGNEAYDQNAGLVACGEGTSEYAVIKCKNSVFYGNIVDDAHEIDLYIETITNQSEKSIVKYNCISPNGLSTSGDSGEVIVEHNISEDPSFENVGVGNFHLNITSPCIDRGDPDSDEDGVYWTIDEDDQDPDGTRLDIGRYYKEHYGDLIHFEEGIQWISFPHLDLLENEQYEQAYYENGDSGLFQLTSLGPCLIDGFLRIDGKNKYITYTQGSGFNDFFFDNKLFRHEGYKIEIDEGYEDFLVIDGELLTSYSLNMPALENFWLGYYIPYPQNIEIAFGEDFWSDVNKVWAEDWFYDKMNNNRGIGEPELPANSTTGKTLEYGKMYIVQMYHNTDDFFWNGSSTVEEPEKKLEAENFSYTEKADYEAIDIIGIPENVTEIGVFEEDICVGAVVVTDSCEQVLAYTTNANREQIPLTFELVVGSRGLRPSVKDYKVLNQSTGQFEPNVIIAGRQDYSAITLGEYNENPTPEISKVLLHNNYPNPFNPVTNISFSIPTEQKTKLTIYNLKGQKVRELVNGQMVSGTHSIVWNGADDNGKQVGSGLYFYKLITSDKVISKKMLLLK